MAAKRFTKAEADEIRTRLEKGEDAEDLASEYGVHLRTIQRYWKSFTAECEDRKLSHQENLRWAMQAAGEYLRTNLHPKVCPTNASWFFYLQAIKDPKDFMAKFNQAESKAEDETVNDVRRSAKKSIEEINKILDKIFNGSENEAQVKEAKEVSQVSGSSISV